MKRILVAVEADDADVAAQLNESLVADNRAKVAGWGGETFLITARDREGKLLGGARGVPNLGACEVRWLWVDPVARGGTGRRIITHLEDEAVRRGYALVFLDTYDFQARGFYEALGYRIFAELEYPTGLRRYWLKKTIG